MIRLDGIYVVVDASWPANDELVHHRHDGEQLLVTHGGLPVIDNGTRTRPGTGHRRVQLESLPVLPADGTQVFPVCG